MDGRVEVLAEDVPERLLEAGERRGEDEVAAIKRAAIIAGPEPLDLARVLADEGAADFADGGFHRLGAALEDGLAPADDARVGGYLEEQPARPDVERLDAGDFQAGAGLLTG